MDTVTGQYAKLIRKSEETIRLDLPILREGDARMNEQTSPSRDNGASVRNEDIQDQPTLELSR